MRSVYFWYHRSGRAELGSWTWFSQAPNGKFSSGGISSHRQGAPSFTLARSYGSSLAQHIASGLSTEVVETFLQSRASSTRKLYALKWKISLPDWYSAGIPAGPTLRRVDPLHLEGLCGGNIRGYHVSQKPFPKC